MQILGKRSKVLLIAISIAMLVAIGISFATWDSSAIKATSVDLSTYANAKVGDVITFGNYYQTGEKDPEDPTEYKKTPIEWIVVDKDERSGQLTLMSKYILAAGSYFGNYYYNNDGTENGTRDAHFDGNATVAGIPYNQAYVDSTVRAYLNNLERLDMGGDEFSSTGYLSSNKNSTMATGLLSSIGFSNQKYLTGQSGADNALLSKPGFSKKTDDNEIFYQRPIEESVFQDRPATIGFYNEAFTDQEKSMIVPKVISGYTGHRWPDSTNDLSTKSYVEGALDKVWLPSASELNVMNGQLDDHWTNPSDEASSTVFEYFKNYQDYGFSSITEAVKATRTTFAQNSFAMNYSIPVYNKGTTEALGSTNETKNLSINPISNSSDHYWTRSASSPFYDLVRFVANTGMFSYTATSFSNVGVRPALILSY